MAAPVGLAVLMLISVTAIHVPGHAQTVAVVLLLLTLAGIVLLLRRSELRPRLTDLLAGAPVAFLALIPFLASARGGTLGVSFDNDMASHLRWAEAIRSPAVARVTGVDSSYPIGPHALCAVLAEALGVRVDYAFAGETMALPVLLGLTTLVVLRRAGWPGRAFVATMTGMTFLVAGYYGQGSFKEIMQALFVLAFALGLQELSAASARPRLRLVPPALIAGGSLSVYSIAGLPWLLAVLVLWALLLVGQRILRGVRHAVIGGLRATVVPTAIALGVLLVAILPQLPRLVKFYENNQGTGEGTGIPASSLGNLVGPVSFWKVFGMWDVADYRQPAAETFHVGMFVAFGLIVCVVGSLWWARHGGLAVPLATGIATLIWIYANRNQSPYVAAKALVILAPLVMLLSTRWLVELRPRESWLSWAGVTRVAIAGLFGWAVLGTSVEALRDAYVDPGTHISELRSIEPLLGRAETLYLGRDDFIEWELAGTPVRQPYLGYPQFPLVAQKEWQPSEPLDFDDIPPETLDTFRYVVAPRDPAGSEPPSNMKLVRTTRLFEVWERTGPTPHRQILGEGPNAGAVLDCATPQGRAVARLRGVAAVRPPSVEAAAPVLGPGSTVTLEMRLSAGAWSLSTPYTSPHPVDVSAPGLHVRLPANLDRPGNRWLIGRVVVPANGRLDLVLHVEKPALAGTDPTELGAVVATPQTPIRTVPLARACGRYVDWYSVS
jgi:hypothetical protein